MFLFLLQRKKLLPLAIFLPMFFSCNQKQALRQPSPDSVKIETEAKGYTKFVDSGKPPQIVLLDTCAKPQTVVIPSKPTLCRMHTQHGDTIISISPPVTKRAGFSAFMQNYTTDNGLALDEITCSCMDHFGNLWFGTGGGGVSRYDGKSFTNYTLTQGLSNSNVWSIFEDSKGNIWIGTDGGGVCCYDGKSFTTFKTKQGISNNCVWSITEDKKGNLWFGTDDGICRFDGKIFTTYTTAQGLGNNDVLSVRVDKAGNIWIATDGGGVSRYDGKSFTTFTTKDGLCNNSVECIYEDKQGKLWFGSNGGGISCYNTKTFTTYTTAQGLGKDSVWAIMEDNQGSLWFGTQGGGVSLYDGKSFTTYTTAEGLSNNYVNSIVKDRAGNMWFGTTGGGLSCFEGKSFTNYTTAEGLPGANIMDILEDKTGKLWFGGVGGGVSNYDGKSFTTYTTAQGLPNNNVMSMLEDRTGNIWFGTKGGGVSRYDGKSFTSYAMAQGMCNYIMGMLEDKKGNVWFGTMGQGLCCFDGESCTTYTTAQGLPEDIILCIIEDRKGNLWFGTDAGLGCFNGKSFTTYTTAQGLGNNTIFSILEDSKGNLWVGTQDGVSRYDGKSFINYTTEDGLSDDGVASVLSDKQQNIVIGTNFGMAVLNCFTPKVQDKNGENKIPAQNNLSNAELENYTPVFKIYNSKTGYPVKDVDAGSNNGAMLCDSKGNIWAGTGSEKTGLVKFEPSEININPNPPTVVIQNVKINKENICWYTIAQLHSSLNGINIATRDSTIVAQQEVMTYGKVLNIQEKDTIRKKYRGIHFDGITPFYPLPENLVLPYQYNHITFDFAAIEPARPYLVKYRYILENYDNAWSPATNKTTAVFGNIYEGTYTFKVMAQSPDGIWSEPIAYTFKVLPPLYRTWWAYSLYLIITVLFFYGIYHWRTASLRKEKLILEQTVHQRTMEAVKQKNEAEKQRNLVEEKNKDITDSINYAKRIQRALLKEEEHVSKHLPEHFILFKPKDIVSGDFYWAIEKQEYFYMAAVDCTGHGVPGGFMSMLGLAFLNELTAGSAILTPAEILDKLREKILKEFRQTGTESETKDGMDISLMRMNLKTREIEWSGANNPLYITNDELKEIPPDKQPIGYYPLMKPFTNHTISVEKGSKVYLFSDGYSDQFGGENGKKFKHSQLKELLFSIREKGMKEQKKILDETFENWKGDLEQVDDILIIGIKV